MPNADLPPTAAAVVGRLPFVGRLYREAVSYRKLKAGVGSAERNALALEHDGLPIPPIRLRDMVRKGGILVEDFLIEGAQAFEALTSLVREHGAEIGPATRVLEFGVGCGRVARHFLARAPCRFHGCDVDEELIGWCHKNLTRPLGEAPAPEFFVNQYRPAIDRTDASYDFIFSISVLTHMTPENQRAWMHELHRLLAPGGWLVVSFLERPASEAPAGVLALERVDHEFSRTWLGRNGAPAMYFNTYNTAGYMRELCPAGLRLIGHRINAIRNTQSLLVFRKQ